MTDGPARFDCFGPGTGTVGMREALALLRAQCAPLTGFEEVPLDQALGRILAKPLVSTRDVPAFDNVAVDGFAFAGSSLAAAGPTRLRLVPGRAAAGHPYLGDALRSGEAIVALTGAAMPPGTDTVVMHEEALREGDEVMVPAGYKAGGNLRAAGEDVHAGQVLFEPGLQLLPQHLGVAAEMGLAGLPVHRKLELALLSSGDELAETGTPLPPGGVFDANRPILKALLQRLPVHVTDLGILEDDAAATRKLLEEVGASHDLVLASGGASKSEADHIVRTVAELGSLGFWQIRMKPGRPLATGQLGKARFIGLPGNPVAATVCFLLFARPAILALAGGSFGEARAFPVPAAFSMRKRPGRTELLRARLRETPTGGFVVERILREGSGILTSLTDADGLVEVPEETTQIEPGDPVRFMSFAELGALG